MSLRRRRPVIVVVLSTFLVLSAHSLGSDIAFEQQGAGYGRATTFQIALGDLDGDGDLDAVFANQGNFDSRILLNDGSGQFVYTDQLLTKNGHGIALEDLDGDGDLDAFIACAYSGGALRPSRVYFNDGHGTFTDSGQDLGDQDISANMVQLVDIDGDSDYDAFLAYLTIPGMDAISRVYLNDGAGFFSPSDEYALPYGTTFADLDLDGDDDALLKLGGEGYRVLLNDGFGQFSESWRLDDSLTYDLPFNAAMGDFDEDGDVDIFDTNGSGQASGPSRLLVGDGQGNFTLADPGLPNAKAAWVLSADFNRDGHLDIFLSLIFEPDQLWLGNGRGGFSDSGVRLAGNHSRGAAVGDVDGDGDLDVFVPEYGFTGGPNALWLNQLND